MGKHKVLNESALKEFQLPQEGYMFWRVINLLRGENLLVKCADGVTRRGRIRGKLKRRVWIRDNDIVIISPWELGQAERGDILWRYTLQPPDWLKHNDHIPKDF